MRHTLIFAALFASACATSSNSAAPATATVLASATPPTATPATTPPSTATTGSTTAPSTATGTASLPSANVGDAPEISRSVGVRGGVVVFWPRVAPRSDDPAIRAVATAVQQRMQQLAERALPGRRVEVRPEPERVCPRAGCDAMTLGASLYHTPAGGCVVVALVSGAGQSPQRLVPWVGSVDLREAVVPFREPPEARIVSRDMARCADVAGLLANNEAAVVEAIRTAAPPF